MIFRILVISFVVLVFGCRSDKAFDVQGHRGYRGLYPENSLIGFRKALEVGVTTLELDVVISKDNRVVVSHEPFMNHEIARDPFGQDISEESELAYNLFNMDYDSIIKYDCGSRVHKRFPDQKKLAVRKPLLSEVIELSEKKSNHSICYNIEIKSQQKFDLIFTPNVEEFVNIVIQLIRDKDIISRVTLQSFDLRALEAINKKDPKIRTALLIDENESIPNKLTQLSFKPDIISPYFKLLNTSLVDSLQNDGYQIIPWTVNDNEDIKAMLELNVNGIISDFPGRVIEILSQ